MKDGTQGLKPDSFCDGNGTRSTRTSLRSVLAQGRLDVVP